MAMNSPGSYLLCFCPTLLLITILHFLLLLLSPASCFSNKPQPFSPRGLLIVEEKARLGSRPPSCHNKCNQCHPCMSVQVPTLPSQDPVQPGSTQTSHHLHRPMDFFDDSSISASAINNRYSNYKPLGWKCRCGSHFYNP